MIELTSRMHNLAPMRHLSNAQSLVVSSSHEQATGLDGLIEVLGDVDGVCTVSDDSPFLSLSLALRGSRQGRVCGQDVPAPLEIGIGKAANV